MDPKKVDSILSWPIPKNLREVQLFLGFANFYRRFIRDYAKLVEPLTRLTRKDTRFDWQDPQKKAFELLKKAFTEAPVLALFDPDKLIYLETDASDYAIGACLSQPDN